MGPARRAVLYRVGYALVALIASQAAVGESNELLGDGDTVRITVFQNPDLTTEARISERGAINFPLIGEVVIGGLAPADAEARIAQQLARGKFVVRPQVNLSVLQVRSRQISVLGQVGRPGRYPLDDVSSKLTDVLALSVGGGLTARGTLHGLEIQRRMPDGQIRDLREVRPTDAVQPNDVILVRERLF